MAKRILRFLVGFLLCCSLTAFGQSKKYGLGLILLDPTGLSGKMWLGKSTALDAAVGWSAREGRYLHIHLDYLFLGAPIYNDDQVEFSFYAGGGAKIIFQDKDSTWLRFPLGLDCKVRKSPLNIFFEIVPSFDLSEFDLFGAIGIRYLFDR